MVSNLDEILSPDIFSDLRQCLQIGIHFDEDCVKALHYLSNKYGHFGEAKKCFGKFIKYIETENASFPFKSLTRTLDMPINNGIGMEPWISFKNPVSSKN